MVGVLDLYGFKGDADQILLTRLCCSRIQVTIFDGDAKIFDTASCTQCHTKLRLKSELAHLREKLANERSNAVRCACSHVARAARSQEIRAQRVSEGKEAPLLRARSFAKGGKLLYR